ncbi:MAG: hypothetical protein K9G11_01685 [Rickettsiaceae bacterium]|nr:hypothetical protein [Rickettsiaceae bacterium]
MKNKPNNYLIFSLFLTIIAIICNWMFAKSENHNVIQLAKQTALDFRNAQTQERKQITQEIKSQVEFLLTHGVDEKYLLKIISDNTAKDCKAWTKLKSLLQKFENEYKAKELDVPDEFITATSNRMSIVLPKAQTLIDNVESIDELFTLLDSITQVKDIKDFAADSYMNSGNRTVENVLLFSVYQSLNKMISNLQEKKEITYTPIYYLDFNQSALYELLNMPKKIIDNIQDAQDLNVINSRYLINTAILDNGNAVAFLAAAHNGYFYGGNRVKTRAHPSKKFAPSDCSSYVGTLLIRNIENLTADQKDFLDGHLDTKTLFNFWSETYWKDNSTSLDIIAQPNNIPAEDLAILSSLFKPILANKLQVGDILVWRHKGGGGHIGFYVKKLNNNSCLVLSLKRNLDNPEIFQEGYVMEKINLAEQDEFYFGLRINTPK